MTERTIVCAVVHACPPNRVRTVLDILDSHCLTTEEEHAIGDIAALATGVEYTTDDIYCGTADLVANELIDRSPEVSFTVYEEPAFDGLGTIRRYVPELGSFRAHCDNSGTPLFTLPMVQEMRELPDDAWDTETGLRWQNAIDAMPAGVVKEPRTYDALWDRRRREIIIGAGQGGNADLVLAAPLTADELVELLAQHGYELASEWSQPLTLIPVWYTELYRAHDDTGHADT